MTAPEGMVPLMRAAERLGVGHGVALRLLLRRELEGRQVGSRWFATAASVERELARRRFAFAVRLFTSTPHTVPVIGTARRRLML